MLTLEPWQWGLVLLCGLLNGIAKTGVPGLTIFAVTLMLYAIPDGRLSGGAQLPLLCLADLFAVVMYRRHADWGRIVTLAPWVGAGLVLGMVALWQVSDRHLTPLMGGLIAVMVLLHWRKRDADPAPHGWWVAACFGILAGFATTVANAAGPVMNLYLLAMALPKNEFMGTGAWFFCIINLVKLPLFVWQERITADTLLIDAWAAPAVIVGALVGRKLFTRVPQQAFGTIILILALLGAVKLMVSG